MPSISRETVQKCREDCLELSRDELDLVVLSQIHFLRGIPEQPTLRQSHHAREVKAGLNSTSMEYQSV